MDTLTIEISKPDTVHTIEETARKLGITPEVYALELLETAITSQKPFAVLVEPVEKDFDESAMSEEEFDALIDAERQAIWEENHRGK